MEINQNMHYLPKCHLGLHEIHDISISYYDIDNLFDLDLLTEVKIGFLTCPLHSMTFYMV